MKLLIVLILFLDLFECNDMILFDFNHQRDLSSWTVVDDGVMGGLSAGKLGMEENGHAIFSGTVSLENNGGFSSIRHYFEPLDVRSYSKVVLKVKGDGKRYQFRLKSSRYHRHTYVHYFVTNSTWQHIEIPLADFYPTFRGRTLNIPNYPGEVMEEIAFLIGNKKAEPFQLWIDQVELQ